MSLDPSGKGRKLWTMHWKAPLNAFEGHLTPGHLACSHVDHRQDGPGQNVRIRIPDAARFELQ
ncbi:hypothetical protein ACFC08_35875 [Streptomyces sp. NPDC056112]|uniref:hypothetical protein n=1 Tax=Streptomyces sp. NPDC056112 TaxID=3345715 RepID=UPI0035E1B0DE